MSTTPRLGITELAPNQSGKETTLNTAILALESAAHAALAVSFAAGDVTLSAAQLTGSMIFDCSGHAANRNLNLPAQVNGVNSNRIFIVRNTSAYVTTVRVTGGAGASVSVKAGEKRFCYVDGAGDVIDVSGGATSSYAVGGFATGSITASEILTDHIISRAMEFPDDFAGSYCTVGTNPTGTTVLDILKNGSSIGSISINTSGVATFSTTGGATSFAAGDLLTIQAPASPDASIARLRYTLIGS